MGGPSITLGSPDESDDDSDVLESLLTPPLPEVDPLPDELPLALSDEDDPSGTDSDTPLPPPPPPPVSEELEGSPPLSPLEVGSLAESELALPDESDPLDADSEAELPLAESLPDEEPPDVESLLESGGTSLLVGSLADESPDEEPLDDWLADELADEDALALDEEEPLADADDELLPGAPEDALAETLAELLDEPEELPELDPEEEPLEEDEPG